MRVVGGTIVVTSGIFATIAAVLTLVVALAGAFQSQGMPQISWAEWGGVAFSFATVFLGATVLHARSVSAGLVLMAASVCGAVIGGAVVAVFMGMVFFGGAVASTAIIAESDRLAPQQSAMTPPPGRRDVVQSTD